MKRVAIFLIIGVCIVLVLMVWHPWQASRPDKPAGTIAAQCDQSLWEYVYNPGRLQILDACISVTGTVDEIRKEADGDLHVIFRLDPEFESRLNEKNISEQRGHLVLEPICQVEVRQKDAAEPCSRYNGPYFEPEVGRRYQVWGTYVQDADHGWNELHPISVMQPIP